MSVSERTVTNPLDRYDELLAVTLTDDRRLKALLAAQGRVVLVLDGLQPDVGHEVVRGAAKLVAGLATRHREVTATDLAGADRAAWQRLRAELETRRERRVERRRFRRDPDGYLRALENKLIQSRLPA